MENDNPAAFPAQRCIGMDTGGPIRRRFQYNKLYRQSVSFLVSPFRKLFQIAHYPKETRSRTLRASYFLLLLFSKGTEGVSVKGKNLNGI